MSLSRSFSPGDSTPVIGALPLLTIEPIAFSTMLESPPFLLPGVVLAPPSVPPLALFLGGRHDLLAHRHEPDVRIVLQAYHIELRIFVHADVGDVAFVDDCEGAGRQ